ncbi:MAG: hypothetical protein KIS81_08895 [Maricaulaceae bacterium]|nr:hypothetical protein [Maricaulaceae bacterium]
MKPDRFSKKLALALKALSLSRAGLAAGLNVDKSLVGRWVSGAVMPSEHNLANLTRFISERVSGFSMLDWERDLDDFAAAIGAQTRPPAEAGMPAWFPASILDEARRNAQTRGWAYEGLWLTTRASNDLPGRYLHDVTMIRLHPEGVIRFRSGIEGVRYEGAALLLQHQLFSIGADADHGSLILGIFNGVTRQRAEVIEGLTLGTLRDAGGSPTASACVLHRIGDLTGDAAEDIRRFEAAVKHYTPLAPEGSVSPEVRDHLARTVTPDVPGFMRLLFAHSISRGPVMKAEQAG